jgi:hypothetical protein
LATTARAFAKLGALDTGSMVMDAVAEACLALPEPLENRVLPQDVANLLWAFAKLGNSGRRTRTSARSRRSPRRRARASARRGKKTRARRLQTKKRERTTRKRLKRLKRSFRESFVHVAAAHDGGVVARRARKSGR